MIYALMPAIFIAAILCIAFEDKIKINKAAVAISSAILLWSMLFMSADGILGNGYSEAFADFSSKVPSIAEMSPHDRYFSFLSQYAIIEHLGDVATTLFFVIGSMIIVEIVDSHGGFRVITDRIHTRSKRRLLVIISLLTFVLSAPFGQPRHGHRNDSHIEKIHSGTKGDVDILLYGGYSGQCRRIVVAHRRCHYYIAMERRKPHSGASDIASVTAGISLHGSAPDNSILHVLQTQRAVEPAQTGARRKRHAPADKETFPHSNTGHRHPIAGIRSRIQRTDRASSPSWA